MAQGTAEIDDEFGAVNIFFKAFPHVGRRREAPDEGRVCRVCRYCPFACHSIPRRGGDAAPYAFTSGVSSFFNIRITIITQYASANAHAIGLAMQMPK